MKKIALCIAVSLISFQLFASTYSVRLKDVTEDWRFAYDLISAFPDVYDPIKVEENYDIMKIFHFYAKSSHDENTDGKPYYLRRIEVFYTGGDWMDYGFVYFITNVDKDIVLNGKPETIYGHQAYFIPELSTTDSEGGETPPEVDPLKDKTLMKFITEKFLKKDGLVNSKYFPICAGEMQDKRKPCDSEDHSSN